MSALTTFTMFTIDCANPGALAEFYAKATGGEVNYNEEEYAGVLFNGIQLGFGRIEGYRGPSWPDDRKHFHIDLRAVGDLEQTVENLLAIGAGKPEFQPGDGKWVVLTDPEGHLFCVSPATQS